MVSVRYSVPQGHPNNLFPAILVYKKRKRRYQLNIFLNPLKSHKLDNILREILNQWAKWENVLGVFDYSSCYIVILLYN